MGSPQTVADFSALVARSELISRTAFDEYVAKLRDAGRFISEHLGRPTGSRVARALASKDPVAA